jgi:hypothetical protein
MKSGAFYLSEKSNSADTAPSGGTMSGIVLTFFVCQLMVVVFIAFHDWLPLGALNNLSAIHATDSRFKLLLTTVLSTLPFAVGLAATAYHLHSSFPMWLGDFLWVTYLAALYGMLRAWWIPYLLKPDPVRAARYQVRFANTAAFLPERNGIRPDTLHVCFHVILVGTFVLLCVLTFSTHQLTVG